MVKYLHVNRGRHFHYSFGWSCSGKTLNSWDPFVGCSITADGVSQWLSIKRFEKPVSVSGDSEQKWPAMQRFLKLPDWLKTFISRWHPSQLILTVKESLCAGLQQTFPTTQQSFLLTHEKIANSKPSEKNQKGNNSVRNQKANNSFHPEEELYDLQAPQWSVALIVLMTVDSTWISWLHLHSSPKTSP